MPKGIPSQSKWCSLDECDGKHHALGYCRAHYVRFKRYGDPLLGGIRHTKNSSPQFHHLTNIVADNRTADCAVCGPTRIRRRVGKRVGVVGWRCIARSHKGYRKHCGTQCEECGYQNPDVRMFDVHHINGDHDDDHEDNLKTLCPICHRAHHLDIAAFPLMEAAS